MVDEICNEVLTGKYRVVMLRSGENEWRKEDRYTGWYNAPLSKRGVKEACQAGKLLDNSMVKFDMAYTSELSRAQRTLELALQQCKQTNVPICKTWRLNERHYGALTGHTKQEILKQYGEQKVKAWYRGYDALPPPLESDHSYYDAIVKSACDAENGPSVKEFPAYESLKMADRRTLSYWCDAIVPQILAGNQVLIVAHASSLRAIIKHLDNISDNDMQELEIPSGIPFAYELKENLSPLVSMRFLANEMQIREAMDHQMGIVRPEVKIQRNSGNYVEESAKELSCYEKDQLAKKTHNGTS